LFDTAYGPAAGGKKSPTTPTKGGTITFGMTVTPVLQSHLSTDFPSSQSSAAYTAFCESKQNIERSETWRKSGSFLPTASPDFTLKKNVFWHDGEKFTSADVKYTYDAIKHEDYTGVRKTDFKPIDSIETPDEYTVVLKLKEPYAPLLTKLNIGILPKHVFESTPIAQMKEHPANMQPIGTGPYTYVEWQKDQYILRKLSISTTASPYIEQVIWKFYGDYHVMLAALGRAISITWALSRPTTSRE
jgi:ABC-type transport system substrate-binding protein